jgi:hypothetical protein
MRPRARQSGFLLRPVGDQLVVFDQTRQRLHVLSRTAALVWRHCDGQRTVTELIEPVGRELGVPADESLITLALEQLDEAQLLEVHLARASGEDSLSRREMLHRAAAALAAGVLLPTITSCGVQGDPMSPGGASLSLNQINTTTTSAATPNVTTTTTSVGTTTTTSAGTTTTTSAGTTTTSAATTPLVTTTTTSAATTPLVTTTTTSAATTTTTTTPAPRKVAMCHEGRTIMVDARAVPSHLAHGDTMGPCPR